MDFKRLMTGIAVAILIVAGWSRLVNYLADQHPEWGWKASTQPTTMPAIESATQPIEQSLVATTGPAATQRSTIATTATGPAGRFAIVATERPTTRPASVDLGSNVPSDPTYTMAVNISDRGAGLNDVLLNEFRRSVESPDLYTFQSPYAGYEDETRPLATRSINIDGTVVNLLGVDWERVSESKDSATFRVTISRDGLPAVEIDKSYTLTKRATDDNSPQGCEVTMAYKVSNLTGTPMKAKLAFNGPTAPPIEQDRADDRSLIGGYYHEGYSGLTHASITELTKDAPTKDMSTDSEKKPLLWVGIGSVYFNAIVRPNPAEPIKIASAVVAGPDFSDPAKHKAYLKLETNAFDVPASSSVVSTSYVFLGPKKRDLLNNAYYAAPLLKYDDTLVMSSGPCMYITSTKIINGLYFLLSIFHAIFRDWGLAIICLVLIVRACLHPITKRSQVNMAKMSKMGPEIERLKKKHGDNKDELNKAMMQFYKTQGATPILGCLPMFLQMPIWIALYSSLQSTFELRQSPFLWGFTWIKDLAHPDRLFYFPDHPLQLLFFHIDAINVLPILLGVVSWIQAKVMRSQQPPATTPEQAQQQKMMQWMTLMLPIILYNGPSGLNLYIMTSTTIGIIESKIVRKHIKEREEMEKAGVVIVDNPPDDLPPAGSVRRKKSDPEPPKSGGLAGWITKLQNKAEEMQKMQQDQKRKKK